MTATPPYKWRLQGVDELEGRAWEALREVERSVCVTAGAGAGKTEFLAQKALYLLQTGLCPPPKRILAISFKRDAARTLATRLAQRCDGDLARRFVSITFDAFTKSIVDQFRTALPEALRPAAGYAVALPNADEMRDFLDDHAIHGLNGKDLETLIAKTRLPLGARKLDGQRRIALEAWWRERVGPGGSNAITFAMLNRLADVVVRINPLVRRVLRETYPFVFLDEFQDTTFPQFQFLLAAFDRLEARFTAVGDDKQRIMGWAGALPNAFSAIEELCNAKRISLRMNWRSSPDLVQVQHIIARHIDPTVEKAEPRRNRQVDGAVSAIWRFGTARDEAIGLATWIKGQISAALPAERIAILVRSRADKAEAELAPALARKGVHLRNMARVVDKIDLQELLTEDLSRLLLPILRLGTRPRDRDAWSDAHERIRILHPMNPDDEAGHAAISDRLSRIVREMRGWMSDNVVPEDWVDQALATVFDLVGETEIRQATQSYHRDGDWQRVRAGFETLLRECATEAASWTQVLDRFEGRGQVPLMTIHKSKGMEFHTMIFFGLDGRTWWSLTPDKEEELKSFFVALTRAEQRAFFTSCAERGGRISWIEELFEGAVPRIAGQAE